MDTENKEVIPMKVSIFGREYPVACPAGEENALLHSAKFVDNEMQKVRNSGKVVGSDRIAVMVSLNIAHELLISRYNQDAAANGEPMMATEADTHSLKRIDDMNQKIDATLQKFQSYLTE